MLVPSHSQSTIASSDHAPRRWPFPPIVYSRHYNIGLAGVERLHPFDSRKYGRAWRLLRGRFGRWLGALRVTPPRATGREDLLHLHTPDSYRVLADMVGYAIDRWG
jgi:hypothetical protein